MSVIIRLQNLPWSANALDIRNFFRGLSIPEGGVHIVGGELGDAFIAFSTDEDARQAMMLDGGKMKEIQVKLLLSSRSEMHKVIETARQSVPILALTAPAPAPVVVPTPAPGLTPFAAVLGSAALGIPGIGNPLEMPQPAVIEPPAPPAPSPPTIVTPADPIPDIDTRDNKKRSSDKRTRSRSRSRSSSRSRSRDTKGRRRRRSRSRDRRRRNRSRSRDRKDRRRDRRDKSRSRERVSPWRQGEGPRKTSPKLDVQANRLNNTGFGSFGSGGMMGNGNGNGPGFIPRGVDSPAMETFDAALSRLQELGKKRNPDAFQVPADDMMNGARGFNGGNNNQATNNTRSDAPRRTRFEPEEGSCVAIRGVPTHTSYGDLRRFFPFMIDKHGIKMINDNLGRRTGNVYVRFCEARSKSLALQRRNNELKGAEVQVEHLPDEEFEAAIDSFLPVRQEEPAPVKPPVVEEPESVFTVIKVEELPLFVKEHDIIKMFNEFSLLSIILSECRATRTRSAYVQFVKAEDARAALARRERLVFGRRTATARPASDEEYEKEKMAQMEREAPAPPQPERAPQFVREPSPAAPQPPALAPAAPRDPRQRRALDAAAPAAGGPLMQPGSQFFPPEFAQQQMMAMGFQAQQFGGFGAGAMDPRWAARQPAAAAPTPVDEDKLDCVLMKGLPQDASDRDIVEFLQETGAAPARIHLMLDVHGDPSGDCFCEFRSEDEARRAAQRHGAKLQGCRVSVDPVPRALVQDALGPEGAAPPPAAAAGLLGDAPPVFFDQAPGGFGPRAPFRPRGGFDRGGGRFDRGGFERRGFERGSFDRSRGARGRGGFDRGGSNFDRETDNFDRNGVAGFNRDEQDLELGIGGFDRGGGFNRGGRGFDRGGRGFGSRGFEPRGRGRGFGRGGRGGFDGERRAEPAEEQEPPEDFGAPGCVVSMENVPFRATVEDILVFFGEFNLGQDDVIRRFNERGQPTGDARVSFRTPFDAQRAVATRHMQPIHERRVALKLL